jgi:acyl carrier protein
MTYHEAQASTGVKSRTSGSTPLPNGVTTAIAVIWSEVLHRDNIEVTDDFFDLGGTSLDLIHVFSKLNAKFGLSLNGSVLEEEATIVHTAQCVETALNK